MLLGERDSCSVSVVVPSSPRVTETRELSFGIQVGPHVEHEVFLGVDSTIAGTASISTAVAAGACSPAVHATTDTLTVLGLASVSWVPQSS